MILKVVILVAKQHKWQATYDWDTLPVVLTLNEVANILRVTRQTVAKYIDNGLLKAGKTDRNYFVSKDNLKAFLDGNI